MISIASPYCKVARTSTGSIRERPQGASGSLPTTGRQPFLVQIFQGVVAVGDPTQKKLGVKQYHRQKNPVSPLPII